jgi:hypothetical protein
LKAVQALNSKRFHRGSDKFSLHAPTMGGGSGVRDSGVISNRAPSTTPIVAAPDAATSHPSTCSSTSPAAVVTRSTST